MDKVQNPRKSEHILCSVCSVCKSGCFEGIQFKYYVLFQMSVFSSHHSFCLFDNPPPSILLAQIVRDIILLYSYLFLIHHNPHILFIFYFLHVH
jgi:hypothetical protein